MKEVNKVQNFIDEVFGDVRCFKDEEDNLWFVVSDIARVLEYADSRKV